MSNDLLRGICSSPTIEDIEKSGDAWVVLLRNKGIITKTDKILDFGAGVGRITIPLKADGFNIEAIERQEQRVKYLEDNGVVAFKSETFSPVQDKRYDMVFANFVFQHMGRGMITKLFKQASEITDKLYFTIPTIDFCKGIYGDKLPGSYQNYDGNKDTKIFEWCDVSYVYSEGEVQKFKDGSSFTSISKVNFANGVNMFLAQKNG